MVGHSLHEVIGGILTEVAGSSVVRLDTACGGQEHICLFTSAGTNICDIDAAVLVDGRVKIIVEIEESDVKPTQVCGKFLTSALTKYADHKDKHPLSDDTVFIQVLDSKKLKDKSAKPQQWRDLEKEIQKIIPINGSTIKHYKLFFGKTEDFTTGEKRNEVIEFLKTHL